MFDIILWQNNFLTLLLSMCDVELLSWVFSILFLFVCENGAVTVCLIQSMHFDSVTLLFEQFAWASVLSYTLI